MKRFLVSCFVTAFVVCSCSSPKEEKVVAEEFPSYEMRTFRLESEGGCANDSSACASYEITYPVFSSLPKPGIDSISTEMNVSMDMGDPESNAHSFESMGGEFIGDFEQYHAEFSESPMGWYFDGEIEVDSLSNSLLCLMASTSYFTGGAHGGYGTYFININPENGKRITLQDRLKPGFEEPLRQIGEKVFTEAYEPTDSISNEDLGFEFPEGMFTLNENYGFTKEGLKFVYNIYEIAPYAAGAQEIVIPYHDLKALLKYSFVFIGPTAGFSKGVIFHRINGELPVGFAQFDKSLRQPYNVLEVNIRLYHSMTHEQ